MEAAGSEFQKVTYPQGNPGQPLVSRAILVSQFRLVKD